MTDSDQLSWPPTVLQIIAVELLIITVAVVVAFVMQSRKRDLV